MSAAPWARAAPGDVAEVATDDDEFLTVDKWPKEVFGAHYHEEFNWIVPMRPGRLVMRVEARELAIDGNQWICIFPRTPHAVVHVSDDCEVLSLFVPSAVMARAYASLRPAPPLAEPFILGGKGAVAQGLALEWGEQRFAERERDDFDEAFAVFLGGWLFRACERRADEVESLALRVRLALRGGLGELAAAFFEERLADTPFPWGELADRAGVSQRTLQRHFVEALGLRPSDVLARLRVERAEESAARPGAAPRRRRHRLRVRIAGPLLHRVQGLDRPVARALPSLSAPETHRNREWKRERMARRDKQPGRDAPHRIDRISASTQRACPPAHEADGMAVRRKVASAEAEPSCAGDHR
ncbi:MAG: hypothetical protein QM820_11520 [Minicystis sp.]